MSRFELLDATRCEGAQFYAMDTKEGHSYETQPYFERASHAVMALNALKPRWFASTFGGKVYVDVRAMVGGRLYADARSFTYLESTLSDLGLASAVKALERTLHKYVALHG